jgi:DNA-binding response OmpR family regulator
MRLLLVEDSARLQRSLRQGLRQRGFAVDAALDGVDGLWYATEHDYDVIILDWMLPTMDGPSFLRELRARGKNTHVLMLSAKHDVEDRVHGLNVGADDYLTKPFAFDELCARIEALLRRRYGAKDPTLRFGAIELDVPARAVRVAGKPLDITPRELGVLELLLYRQGSVVSRQEILDHLYDFDDDIASNMVEVLMHTLRRKLRLAGAGDPIRNRRGHGYLLAEGD